VPSGLKRYHHSGQKHFITFTCLHRQPLLRSNRAKHLVEVALERVRKKYGMRVYAYVVMPEHVHLLVSEPEHDPLAVAIKSLKQGVSRRLIGDADHFWQKRYYDFNMHQGPKFMEKVQYIHRNPVKRGLVDKPEQWPWSSFRNWALGEQGVVEVESDWTLRKRERMGIVPVMKVHEESRSNHA
jgi:putative transposase